MAVRPEREAPPSQPAGCFFRLYWMLAGNLILAVCALLLLRREAWVLSLLDLAYWAAVGLLLAARYADQRFSRRVPGAEPLPWRGYALKVVATASLLWLAGNCFQLA